VRSRVRSRIELPREVIGVGERFAQAQQSLLEICAGTGLDPTEWKALSNDHDGDLRMPDF
jgi:hypothetical protein